MTDVHISYGPPEIDPEVKPILRVIRAARGEIVVKQYAFRRRRIQRWRDEHGRQWGRGTWESV